jgi:hypothetical protein
VTDLERFFRRLVANLAHTDPAQLDQPIPLEDIHQTIVPYRTNRRALELESSEDYELVLLRLCAGEGNYVRTDPEEARARFAEELASPNPDLAVLHQFVGAVVSLRTEPLRRALAPPADPHASYAPPAPPPIPGLDLPTVELPTPEPSGEPEGGDPFDEPDAAEVASDSPRCLYCGGALPAERPARFCPHCGQRQTPPECPRCHTEVEPGWRHCVECGAALADT